MSTEKSYNVNKILKRLKYLKGFDTWREVADYLGESPQTISAWRKRNTQHAAEKIFYKCRNDIKSESLLANANNVEVSGHVYINNHAPRSDARSFAHQLIDDADEDKIKRLIIAMLGVD